MRALASVLRRPRRNAPGSDVAEQAAGPGAVQQSLRLVARLPAVTGAFVPYLNVRVNHPLHTLTLHCHWRNL